jgi:hypothetical protein
MVLQILSSPYPIAPFSSYCSPKNPSIKEYVELRAALSTNTSTRGRGKLSLELARFKSLNSMQTLILSSFSGTTTMLDTQCEYLTTSRKSAFHYFSIYAFTFIKTFGWILLNFCLTVYILLPVVPCVLRYPYLSQTYPHRTKQKHLHNLGAIIVPIFS